MKAADILNSDDSSEDDEYNEKANQLNCVIHIISRLSCTQGSTINQSTALANVKVLFVGYIEHLHYVSTIPNSHTTNRNPLYHLKSKLLQSDEKNKKRNQDRHDAKQRERKQEQTTGNIAKRVKKTCDKKEYLLTFDAGKHGDVHKQDWAKQNITKFHNSNNYNIYQCKVCFEAWPLRVSPQCPQNYTCSRCSREKESPKKFSKENFMLPSAAPTQLSGLTQVEEMLIANALPIMHIYIKP